jgi:hypothetical protein
MKLGYYFCFLTSVCITYGCTNTLKSAQNLKLDLALINLKWTDGFESRDYYWLLERKSDATGVSEITIKNSRYVITPFLLPRFSSELLGCCEFGNINLLDAPSNKNRIDSLNDEYAGYDRLYRGSQLTIGNKYKVSMIKKINNIDCNLSLIKLRATICK